MRVLISGAGIAGPTLAWFLAKTGAHITVVEKAPTLLPHGQNVDIQGSARTVVDKMGLTEEVRRNNTTEKGTQFIDSYGRPFARMPVNEKASSASFTSEFEILRGDLAKVLYEATRNDTQTKYLFDTTIKRVIANTDESVRVELSSGDVEEYDLLVAADGQWSKVRKQVFPSEEIKVRDLGMYAVYYTIPRLPEDNDWWNIYQALGCRIITLRPDPHGTIRAMFTRMPCNDIQKQAWQKASRSDRKTQQELLRHEFADAGWQARRLLDNMDQAPDWYFQAMQQIKMNKWSKGRVICLGDTAFAPTPLTGMGTSLAMLGGYLLAGEISKLNTGQPVSNALDEYERIFRPFVEKICDIPWFVPGIGHPETAFKRAIFRLCIRAVTGIMRTSWIANRNFDTSNDEDFPLPIYPIFEQGRSKK
ncbi:hypothetical protein H2200_012832 [Cladophialophora chaetospira]|uniref:FAD-binding domain-containing protein n=1 Tax=Cladophialophora chaetospira TaxID=386627 RepID=A0AA38WWX2_9EURO|nr:hypothetical protein H2200_012832 [Cladophialophora chaetospira]